MNDKLIHFLDGVRKNSFVRAASFVPKRVMDRISLTSYASSPEAADMRSLKNSCLGKSCFVIGNGPSLSVDDLDKIKGTYSFCANLAYRLFANTEFRPSYYVAADPFFFPDYFNELVKYSGVGEYFVPLASKKRSSLPSNAHCFVVYGPFTLVKGSMMNDDFSDDASRYLAMSYTVTFYSLQLACYMGFKRIYLLGVDHKYQQYVDSKGVLHGSRAGSSYATGIDPNGLSNWNYADSTTHSYEVAKQYADNHGVKILNSTRGGNLEIFDRIDLETAMNDKNLRMVL